LRDASEGEGPEHSHIDASLPKHFHEIDDSISDPLSLYHVRDRTTEQLCKELVGSRLRFGWLHHRSCLFGL